MRLSPFLALLALTPALHASATGGFRPPQVVPLAQEYAGPESGRRLLEGDAARPIGLAVADYDEDGVPDLIAGYDSRDGAWFALHLGNVEAIYSNGSSPGAPFVTPGRVFPVPVTPELLGAGDFDNDGHADVVVAQVGRSSLTLLPGDGRGGFDAPRTLPLAGKVTAMVAGEIDRKDGLADVVVGIVRDGAASLLLFEGAEGALDTAPEAVPLSAAANVLALGHFDDDVFLDLAVGEGNRVRILHGRNNKVQRSAGTRTGVAIPAFETAAELGAPVVSIAAGHYLSNAGDRRQLALLTDGGDVHLIGRDGATSRWSELEQRSTPSGGVGRGALLSARLSGLRTEALVLLDRSGERLHVVRPETPFADGGQVGSIELAGAPVAVLPMRLNGDAAADLVILQEDLNVPSVAAGESASIIVVDAATDNGYSPGDGLCQLSDAIINARTNGERSQGDCVAGVADDTIQFAVTTIDVLAVLPTLTDPGDTIDGTTACGSPPCVELRGNGTLGSGLTIAAAGTTVRGLILDGFDPQGANDEAGIVIDGESGSIVEGNTIRNQANSAGILVKDSSSNTIGGTAPAARNLVTGNQVGVLIQGSPGLGSGNGILGNFIGTDGVASLGNELVGVEVVDAALTEIGGATAGAGNLISANTGPGCCDPGTGVLIRAGVATNSDGPLLQGNLIGTDETGTLRLGGQKTGVEIRDASFALVGGAAATARNVISGNDKLGVMVTWDVLGAGDVADHVIQGNYVGTDLTGTVELHNGGNGGGIELRAVDSLVGGTAPGEGNLISGNWGFGLNIECCTGNRVEGNFIGTDVTGTLALGNSWNGINEFSGDVIIGGTAPGARNVVSANWQEGIAVQFSNGASQILGNSIGTDVTGELPLGNGENGVRLGTDENILGGTTPEARNVIAYNLGAGVWVHGVKNGILGNSIHSNGMLGLDLCTYEVTNDCSDPDGVSPNDPGDTGFAAGNWGQNFPVLTVADATPTPDLTVQGTVDGREYAIVRDYRVEFYGNTGCDASGQGEGARYLGSTVETADAAGDISFNVTLPVAVSDGEAIVATASQITLPELLYSTSEFSACIAASCSSVLPFGETLIAADEGTLAWTTPADVRFVKGPLAGVASYATTGGGLLTAATSLDVSADGPAPGEGLYYLVKPSACGSWQTVAAGEPGRDGGLP